MRFVNRTAITLTPKQRYLEWLHEADASASEITLEQIQKEPTVYLLPECNSVEEGEDFLGEVCEEIFENELGAWLRDTAVWPEDLTFDNFIRWFDYSFHSTVIDLDHRRLRTEEL